MTKRREKGKIPHTEWPEIRARHAAGESLASIARHYGCTGPAIRYIVNHPKLADGATGTDLPRIITRHTDDAVGEAPAQTEVRSIVHSDINQTPPTGRTADKVAIDADLRWRVSSEIASFLTVFDSFLTENSSENYDDLLGATDRLMRVAARIRIELERSSMPPTSGQQPLPARRTRSRVA